VHTALEALRKERGSGSMDKKQETSAHAISLTEDKEEEEEEATEKPATQKKK
jgi:hypothetical protein